MSTQTLVLITFVFLLPHFEMFLLVFVSKLQLVENEQICTREIKRIVLLGYLICNEIAHQVSYQAEVELEEREKRKRG